MCKAELVDDDDDDAFDKKVALDVEWVVNAETVPISIEERKRDGNGKGEDGNQK